jgi:ABC-type phosphate transport system permease subunit
MVVAIAFELARQSSLTLQKFGWQFWQTDIWDPVAAEFGARPLIWGTLYSSVLALLISTPIALGIAIFISELAPQRCANHCSHELLAAIPSIVYGPGIFVRAARAPIRTQYAGLAEERAAVHGPLWAVALGGHCPLDHGDSLHVLGCASSVVPSAARSMLGATR